MKKFLAILLALTMVLSMAACSGNQGEKDGRYDFGDYEVVFKSACIMPNDEGEDSLVVYFDFTNNSESTASYGWTVFEKLTQEKEELEATFVPTNLETLSYVGEASFTDVEPGATIEVGSSYKLVNSTDKVKMNISDLFDKYSYNLTFDLSKLEYVQPQAEANDSAVGSTSGEDVSSNTQGFGDFVSILVPEDFEFQRDSWNEDNPHFVSVKRSDYAYFDFHNYTEETELMKEYEYVKKTYTNEQQDVSANYGGIDWTGFQYGDGWGGYAFEVYAIIGSNYLKVASAGFTFDSDIAVAILGSVVMAGSEDDASDASDTSEIGSEVGSEDGAIPEWLTWWEGDWYGWWILTDATGDYESISGSWWDTCAVIEVNEDLSGYIELWDVDGSREDLLIGAATLKFTEEGAGEHGTMYSVAGQFMDDIPEEGEWIIDPGTLAIDNIITIQSQYEGDDGSYTYKVYLRPWGTLWDDLDESFYPARYYDWYLPLLDAGSDMPYSFE